ncbi:hypothetical protein RBSH_05358 [Rhodopirellula baltica SH28]|uniref:Uncharacterized protein n=1 Tax=Rhodopirellula baltica SH28 TaxID=993517 RepID=K5C8H9_RHOBT|nr:hypothetical protein RBSH_05358 [Rhodopirellula baltica SH28]
MCKFLWRYRQRHAKSKSSLSVIFDSSSVVPGSSFAGGMNSARSRRIADTNFRLQFEQ